MTVRLVTKDLTGAWRCACGNRPGNRGFVPVAKTGESWYEVEGAQEHYACLKCTGIFAHETGELVGNDYYPLEGEASGW